MSYYPATLPGPTRSMHTPKVRVSSPSLPGVGGYAARERDYSGTQEVEFFFTSAQAEEFYTWWKDTLYEGGNWFNANWPALRPGFVVLQFQTEPTFNHVYNGAYRVSATVQVRGSSLEVVNRYLDPYFPSVELLLHGDGTDGGTLFYDSSKNHLTPTVTGPITTKTDAQAFGASSIRTVSGTTSNFLTFTHGFASAGESFTIESFSRMTDFAGTGDGYAEPRGEFFRIESGGLIRHTMNGSIGGVGTLLFTLPNAVAVVATTVGLATVNDRVHVAVVREASNVSTLFVNGRYVIQGTLAGAIDKLFVGNRAGATTKTAGAFIEEVRFTRGVARYTRGGANPLAVVFIPPTKAFPNG